MGDARKLEPACLFRKEDSDALNQKDSTKALNKKVNPRFQLLTVANFPDGISAYHDHDSHLHTREALTGGVYIIYWHARAITASDVTDSLNGFAGIRPAWF